MQAYSDRKREDDPHALPDIEVFEAVYCDDERHETLCIHTVGDPCMACETECDFTPKPGWFWWSCSPGCLPDSDAFGPFDTQDEALADARSFDDSDHCKGCNEIPCECEEGDPDLNPPRWERD